LLVQSSHRPGFLNAPCESLVNIAQVPRTFSFWEFRRSSRKPTAFIDYSPSRGNVS
jgi:hypothetical protein